MPAARVDPVTNWVMGGGSRASSPRGTAAGAVDGWANRIRTGRDASRICDRGAGHSQSVAPGGGAAGWLARTVSRAASYGDPTMQRPSTATMAQPGPATARQNARVRPVRPNARAASGRQRTRLEQARCRKLACAKRRRQRLARLSPAHPPPLGPPPGVIGSNARPRGPINSRTVGMSAGPAAMRSPSGPGPNTSSAALSGSTASVVAPPSDAVRARPEPGSDAIVERRVGLQY